MEYANDITDLEAFATQRERTVLNSLTNAFYIVEEDAEQAALNALTEEHYEVVEHDTVVLDVIAA